MSKNRLLSLLSFVALLAFFTACDKDDDKDKDKEPTKTDLITANSWQGEKALVQGTDVSTHPLLGGMFPDFTTMTVNFKKDKTYNASISINGQQFPISGNWEFMDNESKLQLDLLSSLAMDESIEIGETMEIRELSANRLTLATTVNYTVTVPGFPSQTVPIPAEVYFVKK